MAKKSKEALLDLGEKQKVFNKENFRLITLYKTLFIDGVKAFIAEDPTFEGIKSQVIEIRDDIAFKFYLNRAEVCEFAFGYHDKTNLIHGLFTKRCDDHLYFIKGGNFIKIGRTSNPEVRISALQISSVEELEYIKIFPGRGDYEFQVHAIFDYLRVKGEWFINHPDIHTYINLLSENNTEIATEEGWQFWDDFFTENSVKTAICPTPKT